MKILHLISSGGLFGAEKMLVSLAYQQRQKGIDANIGIFRNYTNPHLEVLDLAEEKNIPVKIFDCKGKFDLRAIFKIKNYIKENNFQIVHSHGYKTDFYAYTATLFKNIRRVATCHTWYSVNAKLKFYEWVDKLILHKFNAVVVVSDELKSELLKAGITDDKVLVINNGIDTDNLLQLGDIEYLKREFNLDSKYKIIASIGRLALDKGHIYLIRAVKELVNKRLDIKCLIIGDGPLREKLDSEVRSLNLESEVILTGIRGDIAQLLRLTDIFVMPSLKEGLPIALLEAMAAKKPVIATNVGAISEVIDQGYDGIIVEPGNTQQLCDSILALLNDPEKAKLLAEKGYSKVRAKFSSQKMADGYIAVYRNE